MRDDNVLFSRFQLTTSLALKNRIVMAPMTRAKAAMGNMPTQAMAEYYARRAAAGLIITECIAINETAYNYPNAPGVFNQDQVHAWRKVTDAVHQEGGHIFMQIWHAGRVSHPSFLSGNLPISASATKMSGQLKRSDNLFYGDTHAATKKEIIELIQDFKIAAINAMNAGFDGVELHGANGYLIDQFLHYHTNHREDEYGGTPENMSRFAVEIITAVGEAIGFDKVGIRLSPGGYIHEISGDLRDNDVFAFLLKQLNHFPIAYVHTGNFDDKVKFKELDDLTMTAFIRKYYQGHVIACGGYDLQEVENKIKNDEFNLIGIGRPFIANPDLLDKFQRKISITPYHVSMLDSLY